MNKAPNRYDRNSKHANYGIFNWLNKVGVVKGELQVKLMNDFLEANKFVATAKGKRSSNQQKWVFISNRFNSFMKYVLSNTELNSKI